MSTNYNFLITGQAVTVFLRGQAYNITPTHPNYHKIRNGVKGKTLSDEQLLELVDTKETIRSYSGGLLEIEDGVLTYKKSNGEEYVLTNALVDRILKAKQEGADFQKLVSFLENLLENPAVESINDLFTFLEHNDLPVTEDGHFLAYKAITLDYLDIHSQRFDNHVGRVVEMRREQVDPDRENACSSGLHAASRGYMNFGGNEKRIVVVKINPRDVVAVPRDHDAQKLRTCRYQVVDEITSFENEAVPQHFARDDEFIHDMNEAYEDLMDEDPFWDDEEEEEEENQLFSLDPVTWVSSASGFTTSKTGYIAAIIEPEDSAGRKLKETLDTNPDVRELLDEYHGMSTKWMGSDHSKNRRYLIFVVKRDDAELRSVRVYTPLVSVVDSNRVNPR